MVLIDICGWIEWLTNGVLSDLFAPYFEINMSEANQKIESIDAVIVPTSVQYELDKWVLREKCIQLALEVVALTEQARVVEISTPIALFAADLSAKYKLSFADAIIYATSQYKKVELITSDDRFEGLPGVTYFKKSP